MKFFEKWVVDKFLKQYLRVALDYLSGPFDGYKTALFSFILVVLLVGQQATSAESLKDLLSMIMELVSQATNVPIGEAQQVTVYALAVALLHKWLKQEDPKDPN